MTANSAVISITASKKCESMECSVCLEKFDSESNEEIIFITKCGHFFHYMCAMSSIRYCIICDYDYPFNYIADSIISIELPHYTNMLTKETIEKNRIAHIAYETSYAYVIMFHEPICLGAYATQDHIEKTHYYIFSKNETIFSIDVRIGRFFFNDLNDIVMNHNLLSMDFNELYKKYGIYKYDRIKVSRSLYNFKINVHQ